MTTIQRARHLSHIPRDRRATPWVALAVAAVLAAVAVLVAGKMGWLR